MFGFLPFKISSDAIIAMVAVSLFSGAVYGIHYSGRVYERKVIAKEAAKAEKRAGETVDDIEGLQGQAEPIIVTETKTIIKQDRDAIRKLGEVEGQLKALRSDYETLIEDIDSEWANGDIPDGVRDQITKIDQLISGL